MKLVSLTDGFGCKKGQIIRAEGNEDQIILDNGTTITKVQSYLYFDELHENPALESLVAKLRALIEGKQTVDCSAVESVLADILSESPAVKSLWD